MYKLCFFAPEDYAEQIKEALFAKGAGRIGNYDKCAWQTLGEGQFRPLKDSRPFLGREGAVERVQEYRVEMVCADAVVREVLAELLRAHPYETPAYELYEIRTLEDFV